MDDGCRQKASPNLNVDLTILSFDVLEELMRTIRAGLLCDYAENAEEYCVWEWAITLGGLTHDIATSVHMLVTHNIVRAPMILNRSLSEYRVRLRYYMKHPDVAVKHISRFETELRSAVSARPIGELEGQMPAELIEGVRDLLEGETVKVPHLSIRQMFDDVYDDKSKLLYDLHYAVGSAFAHGTVLATSDVFRRSDKDDKTTFTFHPQSNVFSLNKTLGEAVGHALEILHHVSMVFRVESRHPELHDRFAALLDLIEPDISRPDVSS